MAFPHCDFHLRLVLLPYDVADVWHDARLLRPVYPVREMALRIPNTLLTGPHGP